MGGAGPWGHDSAPAWSVPGVKGDRSLWVWGSCGVLFSHGDGPACRAELLRDVGMASAAWSEQITWAQGGSRTLLLMGGGGRRKSCDPLQQPKGGGCCKGRLKWPSSHCFAMWNKLSTSVHGCKARYCCIFAEKDCPVLQPSQTHGKPVFLPCGER